MGKNEEAYQIWTSLRKDLNFGYALHRQKLWSFKINSWCHLVLWLKFYTFLIYMDQMRTKSLMITNK